MAPDQNNNQQTLGAVSGVLWICSLVSYWVADSWVVKALFTVCSLVATGIFINACCVRQPGNLMPPPLQSGSLTELPITPESPIRRRFESRGGTASAPGRIPRSRSMSTEMWLTASKTDTTAGTDSSRSPLLPAPISARAISPTGLGFGATPR